MALGLDLRDIMNSGRSVRDEAERPIYVAILVEADAPDELVATVRDRFVPRSAGAKMQVEVVGPDVSATPGRLTDVAIAVVGSGRFVRSSLESARRADIPTVVLALGDRHDVAQRTGHPLLDTLASDDPHELVDEDLGRWLSDRVSSRRIALAHNFGFMRRAVAEDAVRATAFQNGVIGTVALIPGTDFPIMTANQVKMLFQIAAAFGEPVGTERVKELAAIVGGGLVFRGIARTALGFVPGFGWAVRGGIGYTGTLAMGKAAIEYFEAGGTVAGLGSRVAEIRDDIAQRARRRQLGAPVPVDGEVVPPAAAGATSPGSHAGYTPAGDSRALPPEGPVAR